MLVGDKGLLVLSGHAPQSDLFFLVKLRGEGHENALFQPGHANVEVDSIKWCPWLVFHQTYKLIIDPLELFKRFGAFFSQFGL